MSLSKAIKSGKEKRKEYRGAKACDTLCRNHGSCLHCLSNRLHKYLKKDLASKQELSDYRKNFL